MEGILMHREKRNRGTLEILAAMLEAASSGCTKTSIMYSAYLNSAQMKKYVPLLLKDGLLETVDKMCHTTKKGMEVLQVYNDLVNMMPGARLDPLLTTPSFLAPRSERRDSD